MSRGGARPGAGRKAATVPRRPVGLRASERTIYLMGELRGRGVDLNEKLEEMIERIFEGRW